MIIPPREMPATGRRCLQSQMPVHGLQMPARGMQMYMKILKLVMVHGGEKTYLPICRLYLSFTLRQTMSLMMISTDLSTAHAFSLFFLFPLFFSLFFSSFFS